MLDDVGFAQLSCFGGLVATPNIDRIAARGLRYSNYHTTPICSATRASFLTGRNSHTVHMGGHPVFPSDAPGYDTRIPASAGTIAENLRQSGYATFALGKWDHLPLADVTPSGPHTYWPLQQGFDRFYGFLFSETDNFAPGLWRDNTPVEPPRGSDYHLNNDLANQAIAMIDSRDGQARPRPFFMYLATGTAHAPHHAPAAWIERYRGQFDEGWDKARERVLRRQIAEGIVPPGTKLAPRPAGMAAWDSLTAAEKRLYAKEMEVFAAALSYADDQFGRILHELEARGELDNTIVLISSDNGASAEGGTAGTYNELLFATGQLPTAAQNLTHYDRWGGPQTFPHYAFGWAVAGNTPFRYYKQTTYEGGIHVPLIVSDLRPGGARGWRNGFVHVSDVTPTILDLVGVAPAKSVNNVAQSRFDGVSFAATMRAPEARPQHRAQYFEVFGHKALWSDGWKIISPSRLNVWDISTPAALHEPWQLYNLKTDPTERVDLAKRLPGKTAELAQAFMEQAERYNVLPIVGQADSAAVQARRSAADFAERKGEWVYEGPISRIPKQLAPPIDRKSFTATAELDLAMAGATGPIFVIGGRFGGVGFYLDAGRPVFVIRSLQGEVAELRADEALASGRQTLTLTVERRPQSAQSTVSISAGGRTLASRDVDVAIPMVVPETFDIGRDDGTAIASVYEQRPVLAGDVRRLTFRLQP
jgi:arylsulfatase